MERREFLQGTFNFIVGAYVGIHAKKHFKEKQLEERLKHDKEIDERFVHAMVYNMMPTQIYTVKVDGVTKYGESENIVHREAMGIIVKGDFITCNHNIDISRKKVRTPFGMISYDVDVLERKISINDYVLTPVMEDPINDTARLLLPSEASLPDFPAHLNYNPQAGDLVYILGNPRMQGSNIRTATISNIDGNDVFAPNCFGIDKALIPGDSGTPCVDYKARLIGLNTSNFSTNLGYVKRIGEYLK